MPLLVDFLLSCRITIDQGFAAGLIVRANESGSAGYYLRLAPCKSTVSLWRYPQQWVLSRAMASRTMPGLIDYGRPCVLQVIMHRHILDAYVDGRHVLSRAVHDYKHGRVGVFVKDCEAQFTALEARELVE